MAVTLADPQHFGIDPRQMSLRKIMLSFGALYLLPSLEIEETHPTDLHHHTYQDRKADAGGQKIGRPKIAPRLRETRQSSDKRLTTLLAVKLRAQQ